MNQKGEPVISLTPQAIASRARVTERERIFQILKSPHAVGLEALAQRFSLETEMRADQAIEMLGEVLRLATAACRGEFLPGGRCQ